MASSENIIDRIKKTSPDMAEVVSDFIQLAGGEGLLILTDDMTTTEKEMVVFELLLKEGYSAEDAERLAPIRLKESEDIFATF